MLGSTETCLDTDTKLKRIAWLSASDPRKRFDSLMHLFNVESLAACFHELDGTKAVGIDGITKAQYGEHLEENLHDLVERMKRMAYRPLPVRQVLIPKDGQPGAAMRPLGISVLEDKLVQKMMQKVLESVYEPLFLDCSYGFRPGRGCHDAIKALYQHLYHHEVEVVIDVDLANFFGAIDHGLLIELLQEKIGDERLIRYLNRMFKAGVLAEGELVINDEGLPQGSIHMPPTMLRKRVVPRRERALIDAKYHVDAILTNLNAFDQRADQLPTSSPVKLFQARGDFRAELFKPTNDQP